MAPELEQLRYRVYTLQRAVRLTREGLARLAAARLYVLLDGRLSAEELRAAGPSLIAAGADVLQLRDKRLDERRLVERARLLREVTAGAATLLDRQRPARRGPPGPRRRRSPRPRGPLGQGRPDDRRARGPDRRLDAFDRAGPAGGPRRGQLPRRRADVSLGHEAVRGSFPALTFCGRWRRKSGCRPLPSAASGRAIWPRSSPPASAAWPSVEPSLQWPIPPPWCEKWRRGCG